MLKDGPTKLADVGCMSPHLSGVRVTPCEPSFQTTRTPTAYMLDTASLSEDIPANLALAADWRLPNATGEIGQ